MLPDGIYLERDSRVVHYDFKIARPQVTPIQCVKPTIVLSLYLVHHPRLLAVEQDGHGADQVEPVPRLGGRQERKIS